MRRIPRLSRSIDLAIDGSARSLSQCRACACVAGPITSVAAQTTTTAATAPFSTSARQHAQSTKKGGSTPFTEALRKRIWGTDSPPGREDPYSFDSPMRPQRPAKAPERRSSKETDAVAGPRRPTPSGPADYEPAKTWDGLEWVGGKEWQQEQEQVPPFRGFILPAEKLTDKKDVAAALRRALVEVYTAKQDGRPLDNALDQMEDDWTVNVQLRASENGQVLLQERIVEHQDVSINEAAEQVGISPEEIKAWRATSLRDPAVKFAVVKRVMNLTGIRIPDPVIAQSDTAGILLNNLVAREKPQRLAEKLENDPKLTKLRNVKISGRRITPIDKEKDVGRWKVIEQKLLDKNLPLTGHDV